MRVDWKQQKQTTAYQVKQTKARKQPVQLVLENGL